MENVTFVRDLGVTVSQQLDNGEIVGQTLEAYDFGQGAMLALALDEHRDMQDVLSEIELAMVAVIRDALQIRGMARASTPEDSLQLGFLLEGLNRVHGDIGLMIDRVLPIVRAASEPVGVK